ncbi:MAG: glutamate-1-semialdehyde 2,1-aminomutase [Clostridia bacterium]|jgi:glutamate-1-semialdehyde 2,1-aminomutase|nr:glutamate-1-semialdehyde 2,1-aminomutase [Clostridia bacterium]
MVNTYNKSRLLYEEAQRYIPGGVNSPVRAFKAVGEHPVFIKEGFGSKMVDVDGNQYIDYVGSWGPLILGHRHPQVISALENCLASGTSFGAPTELETQLAKMIINAFPAMDMVRMVNSGTEATMSALRLARGYTGRNKIVKFSGCYHGHADPLLINAGSGPLTLGVPSSPGVPTSIAAGTITASYNNLDEIEEIFAEVGEEIAAVIVEPIPGNMGVILPEPGFLEGLREITTRYGALLIFDEVMSGFRVAWGGAQNLYKIDPDLTCLGKIIGGGLPVGAYGGKKEIMEMVAPQGPVYQAGTLSGNPLAMSAGLATLTELAKPGVYEYLSSRTNQLAEGFLQAAEKAGVAISINKLGGMISCFFTGEKVKDFQSATTSNVAQFKAYFHSMLEQGIYLAPSQFEACFLSLAHSEEDVEKTILASEKAFQVASRV